MIVPIAAKPHHRGHILPVARALGADEEMKRRPARSGEVAIVASFGDLKSARREGFERIVMMQHGAGQSYGGDHRTASHPSYAGGDDNEEVGLFLVPNEHSADRWRRRYPSASVAVVGCPRLDSIPQRDGGGVTTVAVSFHWDGYACPEWRSAFDWFKHALVPLSKQVRLIGHVHPNRKHDVQAWYARHGIELVTDFDEVCRRADVYICDNSSTLFEFASTGRPVVVLNAPWYRHDVSHGLRFWDAADVGVQVDRPEYLQLAVGLALDDRNPERREAALDLVYAHRTGGARRAADAIMEWAAMAVAA